MPSSASGLNATATSGGRDATRRRLLGAIVTAGATAASGCAWIESNVFGRTPHPPGTVVVANEDDVAHGVRVVSRLGEDGGSVVAERDLSLSPTEERVLERFLEADATHRVTVSLDDGEAASFDFRPHEGTGRVAITTITEEGSLNRAIEET